MTTQNVFLEAALQHAKRGWAVFPLVPRGKTPLVPTGFKAASKDADVIEAWWKKWPDANIGIATGSASGLVVLDFDLKSGGVGTFQELVHAQMLPETFEVSTGGGGVHLYYSRPDFAVGNKQGLRPGMDVRGDGGYVVAPGSIHESGIPYVETNYSESPKSLPTWVASAAPVVASSERSSVVLPEGVRGELAKSTLRFILEGSNAWHADMFKAVMDMKQNGYDQGECLEKLESAGLVMDDTHDLPLVMDVYANRAPKHPPRVSEETLGHVPAGAAPGGESLVLESTGLLHTMNIYLDDKETVMGERTGLDDLDSILGGGFRIGELTAWQAEAGTGKNTFWHKIMHNLLERGIPIGYASFEMDPATEILPNLMSLHFQLNAWKEQPKKEYAEVLTTWPLYFCNTDVITSVDTQIEEWVDALVARGVQHFFFDHLHYMLDNPEDHAMASKLIKRIKKMTKTKPICVQLITQPNKLMEGQSLSGNTMKGGAAINQAVSNMLAMEYLKADDFPGMDVKNIRKITLRKGRFKLTQKNQPVYVQYNPETTDFLELKFEIDHTQPQPVRKSWGKAHELDS